ncbi:MAG: spore coat associated protein CotJA [Ruminococcus sp.]|nr:spore coat associated protein CotJA [Candidatus Apopatosoma intestinale]
MSRAAVPTAAMPDENYEEESENCLAGRSLAMVYSPCQQFRELYEPDEALTKGTLFRELDKPFYATRRGF